MTLLAHVYTEEVLPLIHFAHKRFLANPTDIAVQSAHALAFHRGLGTPTASASTTPYTKYLEPQLIEWYSKVAYAKPNFALVANGAEHAELSKWTNEFFDGVPSAPIEQDQTGSQQTKYFGGEERIAHDGANVVVLAFPGSSSITGGFYKPEVAVLSSLLGGQSNIKWSSGFSLLGNAKASPGTKVNTTNAVYSDAGLLYTTITGEASSVAKTAKATVEIIKKIASGDIPKEGITKAKAAAKFKELETGQDVKAGLLLTGDGLVNNNQAYQIDEVAKKIDAVTEEQVKEVSLASLLMLALHSLTLDRPPSHYWRTGLQYRLSVTSSAYRMLRNSASKCKYRPSRKVRLRLGVEKSACQGLCVPLPVISPR